MDTVQWTGQSEKKCVRKGHQHTGRERDKETDQQILGHASPRRKVVENAINILSDIETKGQATDTWTRKSNKRIIREGHQHSDR